MGIVFATIWANGVVFGGDIVGREALHACGVLEEGLYEVMSPCSDDDRVRISTVMEGECVLLQRRLTRGRMAKFVGRTSLCRTRTNAHVRVSSLLSVEHDALVKVAVGLCTSPPCCVRGEGE